jgi:hypothetical protein
MKVLLSIMGDKESISNMFRFELKLSLNNYQKKKEIGEIQHQIGFWFRFEDKIFFVCSFESKDFFICVVVVDRHYDKIPSSLSRASG